MSKRPLEPTAPEKATIKQSKPSSEEDTENEHDHDENQATFQDSGYVGSQGKDVQPMDLDEYNEQGSKADAGCSGFQGKDVQLMDLDQNSIQTWPEQGSSVGDGMSSGTNVLSKEDFLHLLLDEDSNQGPHAEMIGRTDNKNRPFAENVLHCAVTIAPDAASKQKKEKNKRKKEGLHDKDVGTCQYCVLKNTCALLNSGGGVLVIKIADFQSLSENSLDEFWKSIEPKLKTMINPSTYMYDEVFDRREESDRVLLFINAPQHFCTMEYNLFLSGDAGLYEASYDQTVKLILQKESSQLGKKKKTASVDVPLKDLIPTVPRVFRYKEKLSCHESKQCQLKHFTSETYLDGNNRSQRQGISRQMSAFANTSGGVILLGVKDKTTEVYGLNINKKNSKEDIEKRVTSIVEKMSMFCHQFTLERGVHWNIEFFPVSGSESDAAHVVVISVAGMGRSGGVFTSCPKGFELRPGDDEKEVPCLLEFQEWRRKMLSEMELQSNSKAAEAMIAKFHKLQISKGHLLTVKGDVQEIRDAFFAVKDTFPVMPEGFELNLPQEAQAVIMEIQKKCSKRRNRGLLVASHSWLSNVGGQRKDGVICDLLLVSRNFGGLHLLTLCHSGDDVKFLAEYSKETAQSIKTSLVKDGACKEKFYVVPHVVSCTGTNTELALLHDERYPQSYDLKVSRVKLNEVLKALVIILATVPSTLSSKLGVNIMNLLTKEQFQLVHQQIEINRELWIQGAAGTGKTLVAIEFMRELQRREKLDTEEILCVCENAGIRNQIRESKVCEVVCRQMFEKRQQFTKVRHVVMDEAHNYEVSGTKDSLYEMARHLVRQHDPNRPGYLWIFIDKCQKNHIFPSGMPDETLQKPVFTLKKVIRNSRKIFNYAKKYLTKDVRDILEIGHDFDGESVDLVTYSVSEKSQVDVVNEKIESLLKDGFRTKDIAVLFIREKSIQSALSVNYCTAEDNNSDLLAVSTVLKYSGLERPVAVLVGVEDEDGIPWGRERDPFIYCAVTRAMVKLVIIRSRT